MASPDWKKMSQRNVQVVVGRLLTDEDFRLRFLDDPRAALVALIDRGVELTAGEVEALVRTDRRLWTDAASRIDSHLQQCRLSGDSL